MNDLISRDDLIKMIQLSCSPMVANYLIEAINSLPTADVAPVVHGEWIMINEQLAKCSVCGGYESTNGKDKTGKGVIFKMQKKFCPHCGAKMDADVIRHLEFLDKLKSCGTDMRGEDDAEIH